MKKTILIVFLSLLLAVPVFASKRKQNERLEEAGAVMTEVLGIPEGSIPADLLRKAECVVVIPSMKKAAFGIGGNYGKGCMVCRIQNAWSPPVMMQMTGGSVGFQLGGSSTDVILLVMNKRGAEKLLQSKVTLGGDAAAAAGPKGRSAAAMTDVQMRAEILSYARSRGLFAGISLNGSVLKPDPDDNEDLYGDPIRPKEILLKGGSMPSGAGDLIAVLGKYPSAERIDPVDEDSDR
jgi:lipid-binding SYLF domain-containing protein